MTTKTEIKRDKQAQFKNSFDCIAIYAKEGAADVGMTRDKLKKALASITSMKNDIQILESKIGEEFNNLK